MKLGMNDMRSLQEVTRDGGDGERYNLSHPYLDAEKQLLIVTNGHALLVTAVEVEEDEMSGHLQMESLALFARASEPSVDEVGEKKFDEVSIHCGKHTVVKVNGLGTLFERPRGKFPYWEAVVPVRSGMPTVTVNAQMLLDVQQAMGAEGINLWIDGDTGGILVSPLVNKGAQPCLAVVMPMRHGGAQAPTIKGLSKRRPVPIAK